MIVDLLEWLNAGSLLPAPRVVEPYLRDDLDLPAIVYEIQSEEIERDLLTVVGTIRLSTVSFRCLSSTYAVAESTSQGLITRLGNYSITQSTDIRGISIQSLDRSYSLPVESSNEILYEVDVSVVVSWSS